MVWALTVLATPCKRTYAHAVLFSASEPDVLQQYVNCELSDVQAGFKKGRGTRDQIANINWIIEKAREFQEKTSISALLTMPKSLTVWITINWKILKRDGHTRPPDLPLEKPICRSGSNS